MLATEKEARERWCPMVRAPVWPRDVPPPAPITAVNTNDEGQRLLRVLSRDMAPSQCACIGSRCMMWQWAEPVHHPVRGIVYSGLTDAEMDKLNGKEPERAWARVPESYVWEIDEEMGGIWLEPEAAYNERCAQIAASRQGCCGLAGTAGYAP